MKKTVIYVIIASAIFYCCSDKVSVDNKPQLELNVINQEGNAVSDAVVLLYGSHDNMINQDSIIYQISTNSNGAVLFTNLEEQVYHFYIFKGNLNNKREVNKLSDPLKTNTRAKLLVTIK